VTISNSDYNTGYNFTWPDDNPNNWDNISSWYDPVHVSYHWLQNGQIVSHGNNRCSLPHNLAPGQGNTVNLPITAPSTPGTYQLQIDMVEEVTMWFRWMHANYVEATITVGNPAPAWSASYSPVSFPTNVTPGSLTNIPVTVQNTGSSTWTPNDTWLAVHTQGNLGDGADIVTVGQNVAPGQSYTFTLPFKAPDPVTPNFQGVWNFTIDLAQTQGGWWNNGFWFSSQGSNYVNGSVMVRGADGFSSAPITTPTDMAPGSTAAVAVTLTNTGQSTWDNNVWLSAGWFTNNTTFVENDNNNQNGNNVVQGTVPPGESYTFHYLVTAPSTPGTYQLRFVLKDNITGTVAGNDYGGWFTGVNGNTSNTINVGTVYGVHYSPVTAPTVMAAGSSATVNVTAENTGDFTWLAGGGNPVLIAYHWLQNGNVAVWNGNPGGLPNNVAPTQSVTVGVPVTAPGSPGNYTLQIDTVQQAITWFSQQGASVVNIPVTIPSGQEMTGELTQSQGNYWIGTTEVIPNGISVGGYLDKNVNAWGTVTPADYYFLATDVEPAQDYNNNLSATTQYDPNLDCAVYTETVNGIQYAVAQVRYHYPVSIPTLPMLLNEGAAPLNNSETVYGTAKFPMGT
jgi:hypothetical protein